MVARSITSVRASSCHTSGRNRSAIRAMKLRSSGIASAAGAAGTTKAVPRSPATGISRRSEFRGIDVADPPGDDRDRDHRPAVGAHEQARQQARVERAELGAQRRGREAELGEDVAQVVEVEVVGEMRQRLEQPAPVAAPVERGEHRHQAPGEGRDGAEIADPAAAQRLDQRLGRAQRQLLGERGHATAPIGARARGASATRGTSSPSASSKRRSARSSSDGR